ncbi:Gfo/Idh/MocA family protein [Vibrio ostreicida]|uniref:Gfo/Idh/MocA family oxidoreductase n=1 Tax=Vibrio ostreicida TaxID=526588 RepID=A0ABT8BZG7_9VIBR|nr:Gfo/Idh/MocA family oxidoreductase [Vibrio ostreicida]MDN3612555.1 Gfo/Idh/MocA family oxidoreductase [Vibrio ostreicida]NPD09176.1 Gfo/Idh/MocA family oxidoreductase [Vibrio ostreicida]
MMRLAVVGTNWITDQFIDAAQRTQQYVLAGVYSRSIEKAQEFAQKYASPILFDDLAELATSSEIDVVYIASPNSLHAPQAITLLEAGKHVICEKPLAANERLAKQMYQTAVDHGVILFEAFMSPYTPNFQRLKQEIATLGPIRKALISYCQFSSRYPRYLAGELPNTFNPAFANGSIMDIGYYCLGSAVELFGEPLSVNAHAQMLPSGVDGSGSVILGYEGFEVVLQHSKTSDSFLPSEIQGEQGALQMEMIATGKGLSKHTKQDGRIDLSVEQDPNPMVYEALEFARQFEHQEINQAAMQRSLVVAKLLTEIRRQTGVTFASD